MEKNKMGPVSIREYEARDAAEVANLCGQLGYPATEAQVTERAGRMGPHSCLLVAEDCGSKAVVGWIELLALTHLVSDECLEISGLVVSEEARSRGIGAALVASAEEKAKRMGMRRVRVRSNVIRERAHAFYRRLGYSDVKTSKVFEKAL